MNGTKKDTRAASGIWRRRKAREAAQIAQVENTAVRLGSERKGRAVISFWLAMGILATLLSGPAAAGDQGPRSLSPRVSRSGTNVDRSVGMTSRSLTSQDPVQERRVDGDPSSGGEALPAPMLGLGESRTFEATAYALHGVTRNGVYVRRGVIAADPRILPLGSIVQLTSDQYSGVYRVHDTGGLIKGEIIDLWVPTSQEARQFGRRKVKIQVLKLGKRRARP